jgi:hypothetical protein
MLSSRTNEAEWVGGIVQIPAYATDDGAPYRPEALFWLDATGAVCAAQVGRPGELAQLAAEILQQSIADQARAGQQLPTRVRVASSELVELLRAALPALDITCGATPELDALVEQMRDQFSEDAVQEQTYLAGEASVESMRALFGATAALYRAAPWRTRLPEHASIVVTIPQLDLTNAVLAFTGRLGRSPGVVLLDSLAHYREYRAALPLLARGDRPSLPSQLALNFERGAELSQAQRKEIDTHRWEVAGPNAYPWLVVLDEDLVARAPTLGEIALAEVLARALCMLFTDHRAELKSAYQGGAPLRRELGVTTQLGELKVHLTALLQPEAALGQDGHSKVAANTGMTSPLSSDLTQPR